MRADTLVNLSVVGCPLYSCFGIKCRGCGQLNAHYLRDLAELGQSPYAEYVAECPKCLSKTAYPVYNLVYKALKVKGYRVGAHPKEIRYKILQRHISGYDNRGRPIVFDSPYLHTTYPRYSYKNTLARLNYRLF